jgi:class 3 adenylate cyclase
MDYSLTGDTVNTGKRIEMITKDLPNAILASESVYEKTMDLVDYKDFEPLHVKGKKEKIKVYQVLGRK